MKKNVYLDHNANTFVDPSVAKAICGYMETIVGNPSSIHQFGRRSKKHLTSSRDQIARYLNVRPDEVIFNSGGTEGANSIIRGVFDDNPRGHIVTSTLEHSCVYNTVKIMEKRGAQATYLIPGSWGAPKVEDVEAAIREDTRLIAIMAANNETGVKSDVEGIASVALDAGIPLFVDAVALLGREELVIPEGVSAMAFSGQKIHAPMGIGFCFIRRNFKLSPLITAGGQQFGRRAGTENVPGIVGLTEAIRLLTPLTDSMEKLRDHFENALQNNLPDVEINGRGPRVSNTSNLYFKGVGGETLLSKLDLAGVAASHGSACSSGSIEPSRVLVNMGYSMERVLSSLRFSISRKTTQQEIDYAVDVITRTVRELRSLNSF